MAYAGTGASLLGAGDAQFPKLRNTFCDVSDCSRCDASDNERETLAPMKSACCCSRYAALDRRNCASVDGVRKQRLNQPSVRHKRLFHADQWWCT